MSEGLKGFFGFLIIIGIIIIGVRYVNKIYTPTCYSRGGNHGEYLRRMAINEGHGEYFINYKGCISFKYFDKEGDK